MALLPYNAEQQSALATMLRAMHATSPNPADKEITPEEYANAREKTAKALIDGAIAGPEGRLERIKALIEQVSGAIQSDAPQKLDNKSLQTAVEVATMVGRTMRGQGVSVALETATDLIKPAAVANKDQEAAKTAAASLAAERGGKGK